jgi:L-alanine-DL-glutamate epimerase-like enolase superfamily enzyme
MEITDFRTTIVSIPFREPETWAFGHVFGISVILLELETDTGLVGLGECPMFPNIRVANEVLASMRPVVLGRDPFDHEVIAHELYQQQGWHHFRRTANMAIAAIDCAMWDLVGQAVGQPLYKLFGGAFRKLIPYYYYLPDKDINEMAVEAKNAVEKGFDTIYVKLRGDMSHNVEVCEAVREAIGAHNKLRVDANESWSETGMAAVMMRKLAEYDIEFFEQPVLYYDHESAARLRRSTGLPVAANQSAWTEAETLEVLRRDAADVVLTDPHQVGGLMPFSRVAWTLAALGIPVMKHTFGDLGVTTHASMHVMASAPNFTKANQTHYSVLVDDIIEGGVPEFHKGCLIVPENPGIGVKLDPRRVQKWAQYTKDHGEFSAFGFKQNREAIGV